MNDRMPDFIPGLELSRVFYGEVVRPILERQMPGLSYAAAHIGPGSDVLGFDTAMSRDHDWGPTISLFLREADAERGEEIRALLRQSVPGQVRARLDGRATTPDDPTALALAEIAERMGDQRIFATTVREFAWAWLRYDPGQPPTAAEWLTFPQQELRSITGGAVHHDGVGELTVLRQRLAYYPHDVWLYLLAAGWQRIGQEEHLMPRAGFVGDELGSALIGARLVHDVMSLCFLMERVYAPYAKWFGTAFGYLACAPTLQPILRRAQQAATWPEREAALAAAYETIAGMHNALGITDPLPTTVAEFFDRPFKVISGGRFAEAIRAHITDPDVRRIADKRLIGSIDQFSDSTDLRAHTEWREALRRLYE